MWVSSISRESFRLSALAVFAAGLIASSACLFAPGASAAPVGTKGYIVVLKDDVAHPANLAHRHEDNRGAEVDHIYESAIKGYSADLTSGELKAIDQDPNVDYVEPDHAIHAYAQYPSTAIPRVGALGNPQLDIDEVDDAPIDADIAIIDTGVATHRELNIAGRTECLGAGYTGSCVDGTGYPGSQGHGTHVAGIAAAKDNAEGVVGSAPGARIWSVRVLDEEGAGNLSDEIAGIDWVTAHASTIEVANMSLGGEEPLAQSEHDALSASIEKGVVYTVSAGNDQHNASRNSPASDPQVITVSAITDYDGAPGSLTQSWCGQLEIDDALANYSNFGAVVDIAAPGTCIRSTWLNGGYAWRETNDEMTNMSGTSMAAPLVAGAAAVMASQSNPQNRSDVEGIRNALCWQGSFNWTDDSGDRFKEPLLNMSGPVRRSSVPVAAPSATTTANPAVGTGSVYLDGWFNPNGADTRYYFEYGPTTSYGSTIPAMPGSGVYSGTAVQHAQQFVSGLTVNATYHYRLVAWSAGGTTYGADQAFTTAPYPVEGSTGSAEKVDLQGATLTASVSPRGANAYYKFEYGTTTSYGSATAAQFAGNGSPVTVKDTVSGLAPNTTYHYRLKAWNSGGEIAGADKTFRTAPYEGSSTWSVRMPSTSANAWEWVFYRGAEGKLTERLYNGTSWQTYAIGGQVASGSTPAVVRVPSENSEDKVWVFYRGAVDGKLTVASYTAGIGWTTQGLNVEMAAGTSPSVVRSPTFDPNDRIWVFTNGKNGKLQYSLFSGGGWTNTELATQLAPGTSPAAVRAPSSDPNDRIWVFSNGLNGKLQNTYYAGGVTGGWANMELGTQMSPGSSPAVLRAPASNGFLGVFTNTGGSLGETYTVGGAWGFANLGAQMEAGTSPAAVRAPTPETQGFAAIFTHGPKGPNGEPGRLGETYYAGSAWAFAQLATQMEAGTSPSALRAPSTESQAFAAVFTMGPKGPNGEQGRMGQTYYTSGWAFMDMGVPMFWF